MIRANDVTTNAWLPMPRPNPRARLRLFCFPYAGGGTSIFRTWADALPSTVEVCPVLLPGREHRLREAPYTALPALAAAVAQALQPYLDKPYAFFGHSMGALLSFELARVLRHQQQHPMQLFVSGCRAPHLPDPTPQLYALPEPEFIDGLRRLRGTPQEILEHPEIMQVLLPALRADLTAYDTYMYLPAPPLSCSISAFGGLADQKSTRDLIEPWREHTDGFFAAWMLPGDHFFLHSSQGLLLQTLSRELQRLAKQA